jgi:hypothetical protein
MSPPDFIIVGAPKAATTWLLTMLQQQPRVYMPAPELHFFSREHERGRDWYAAQFAAARPGQLVGEKSASYLADPRAAARIRAALPEVRLIVQLRNPVERAYSDYCMLLRRGEVDAEIGRYLDSERTPLRRFLDDGLYARHLAAFLELFPQERLKILLYDDIKRNPAGVFDEVTSFLGLVDPVRPDGPGKRVKDKEAPMLPLAVRRLLAPLKGAARPWRGHPLFERGRALLARPVLYPPLDDALRRRLGAFYAADVRALERLLGRDLGGWLQSTGPSR